MNIRTFGVIVLVLFVALLGYLGYLFAKRWEPYTVGGKYEVRRNRITGIVEIRNNGKWEQSLRNDPYADTLSDADLQRVTLRDVAFGDRGLLCATAVVKPGGPPVKGRLAVQAVILGPDNKRRTIQSERVMRGTVDWPAGATVPFVVATGVDPPAPKETFRVALITVHSEAGLKAETP